MTNKNESKYSMELGLRDYFNQNVTITATIPNFGPLYQTFTGNLNQIQVIRLLQEVDKTGISDNKELLRADLIAKALDVSRKTEAYAKIANNVVLTKEVHYSESDLKKSADSVLKDRASLIHDKANANLAALATYGVTAASSYDAVKVQLTCLMRRYPSPGLVYTEKKQATAQAEQASKGE
jgi:hypothetical protein